MGASLQLQTKRRSGGGLLAALVLTLGLSSCQSLPGTAATPSDDSSPGSDVGSVSLQLSLGGSFQFQTVSYDISGNGFHRAANVNVSASTTLSTVVSGIPFGTGYTIALTASDVAHKLTACTGSAMFDIASAATVPVGVHLTCHELPPTPPPPPPSVPMPRVASYALAALLLALGARLLRRPAA